jgi:hypothetical protein
MTPQQWPDAPTPTDQETAVTSKPVAWLHEVQEPDRQHPLSLFSRDDANPWSHWRADHKAKCVFKSTPLYAAPQDDTAMTALTDEQIDSLLCGLDTIARDYEHYEYGLPLDGMEEGEGGPPLSNLREEVKRWFARYGSGDKKEVGTDWLKEQMRLANSPSDSDQAFRARSLVAARHSADTDRPRSDEKESDIDGWLEEVALLTARLDGYLTSPEQVRLGDALTATLAKLRERLKDSQ